MTDIQFYLASQSPRRAELLSQIGFRFETLSVNCDESTLEYENAIDYVKRLALEKAKTGFANLGRLQKEIRPVLGSDTAVVVENHILGKPKDYNHAVEMWDLLGGRKHRVLTGVALATERECFSVVQTSVVEMRHLSAQEKEWYWNTQEPQDKAGAYGIQGKAAIFIKEMSGSYSGIMGLPLYETCQLLEKAGIQVI
ncbi:MAG: Maf family nucleotide pyrophosphatase [Gammaproteobacteria bacterium]|nr:Maf family nucleotide pyrophosphatase [Gammaproteobacteria bacterium]